MERIRMDKAIGEAISLRKAYLDAARNVVETCPDIVQIVTDGKKERATFYRRIENDGSTASIYPS
jgi:hypothetical protein